LEGGGTDAPVTVDAHTDADAGDDGPSDDGPMPRHGLPPDPGRISCGIQSCDLDGSVCCVYAGGDYVPGLEYPFGSEECHVGSRPDFGGLTTAGTRACDEPADCPAGQMCCVTSAWATAVCAASCPTGERLCKAHAECGDAGPCIVQVCGGISGYPTREIQTCGRVPHDAGW